MPSKTRQFTHRIPGRGKFNILIDDLDGFCSHANWLVIARGLKGRYAIEVAIHEYLHALHPEWSERKVDTHAVALSKFLWKMGFRPKY